MVKNNLVVLYKNDNKYTIVVDSKDKLKNLKKVIFLTKRLKNGSLVILFIEAQKKCAENILKKYAEV